MRWVRRCTSVQGVGSRLWILMARRCSPLLRYSTSTLSQKHLWISARGTYESNSLLPWLDFYAKIQKVFGTVQWHNTGSCLMLIFLIILSISLIFTRIRLCLIGKYVQCHTSSAQLFLSLSVVPNSVKALKIVWISLEIRDHLSKKQDIKSGYNWHQTNCRKSCGTVPLTLVCRILHALSMLVKFKISCREQILNENTNPLWFPAVWFIQSWLCTCVADMLPRVQMIGREADLIV